MTTSEVVQLICRFEGLLSSKYVSDDMVREWLLKLTEEQRIELNKYAAMWERERDKCDTHYLQLMLKRKEVLKEKPLK